MPNAAVEGGGERIEFQALDAARTFLKAGQIANGVTPGIYPLSDGGVQVEWSDSERVTTVEISADLNYVVFSLHVPSDVAVDLETADLKAAVDAFNEALA